MEPQAWDALIEVHKQGVVVGSLLGGFAMSSAFNSYAGTWNTRIDKYLSLTALIAGVSLISMVCISALVLFIFSDIKFRVYRELSIDPNNFMHTLSMMNLLLGTIGLSSLFTMFGLMGWEKGKRFGVITTTIASVGVIMLILAFFMVYHGYQLPNYGKLPYLPGL